MKNLFAALSFLLIGATTSTVSAQQMKLWKNGEVIFQSPVTNVDSITFTNNDETPYVQLEDIIGTWRIAYSKGKEVRNGIVQKEWDEDAEAQNNCAVFTEEKVMNFMEYSPMDESDGTPGLWHEDGTAPFNIDNGVFSFEKGYHIDANILSFDKDEMTMEYTIYFSDDTYERYIDTAHRINKRTDVLRTKENPDASQPDDIPYLTRQDIIGTWLITHTKRVERKDRVIVDKKSEDVEEEKCYFVIFPDNKIGIIEYSPYSDSWHLDGGTYIPYTFADGRMTFLTGHIMQCSNGEAKVFTEYPKDGGGIRTEISTIRRVSTATDYIKYRE